MALLILERVILGLVLIHFVLEVGLGFSLFGSKFEFKQPKHAPGVVVADHARHDLPPIRMGERVLDLTSGVNFVGLKKSSKYVGSTRLTQYCYD